MSNPDTTPTGNDVPIVQFEGVTKTYDAGTKRAFTAIKDVNFVVKNRPGHGEFIGILGPSGCGKSTILRLIAGLSPQHPPTEGTVRVRGDTVTEPGADRVMVFQDYTSFSNRTVLDNVAFGLECQGVPKKERHERAIEWIGREQGNIVRFSQGQGIAAVYHPLSCLLL